MTTAPSTTSGLLARCKSRVKRLKVETYTLYLAYRDPRVPWYAKVFTACVVAYAFSPIDLIPDFVPILGYLDDLILVPLGIALALRMIPASVLKDCREEASRTLVEAGRTLSSDRPRNWVAGVVIVALWVLSISLTGFFVYRSLRS